MVLSQTNAAILVYIEGKLCNRGDRKPFNGGVFALHKNSQKQFDGFLKDGEMDKRWTFRYDNGKKQSSGIFKNNEKAGKWIYWNRNGRIESVDYYPFEPKHNTLELNILEVITEKPKSNEKKSSNYFLPYDKPPVPKKPIKPVYPLKARRAGFEGTIVVIVYVDSTGSVAETIILKGIPRSGLDEAAEKAIKKVKFEPAEKGGSPVGVWIKLPINFRLNYH